jgi:hypothetical protein
MKYLLIAIIFILPINGQKESTQPNGQQSHSGNIVKPSPSPITQNKPPDNRDGASNDPKGYFSRLLSPENLPSVGLFIAGIIGILVAIKTLRAIKRQGDWLKRQTVILVEYNKATRDSADAANRSVKLVISKERARITIETPDSLKLPPDSNGLSFMPCIKYRVRLFGPTEAIIMESRGGSYVSDSDKPSANEPELKLWIPKIISPKDSPVEATSIFHATASEIEDIRQDKRFVHFWGIIWYRDIFENDYPVRFRYIWKFSNMPSVSNPGERWGRWEECEDTDDNNYPPNPTKTRHPPPS